MKKTLHTVDDIIKVFGSRAALAAKAAVGVKAISHWSTSNSLPPCHLPIITKELERRGYEVDFRLWRFERKISKRHKFAEQNHVA